MCLPPGTRLLAESERPLLISESCKTVSGPECFFSVQIPGSLSPKSKLSGCCLLLERSAFKGSGNRRPQDEQSNPPGISSGVVPAVTVVELFRASLRTEWAGPGRRFCYGGLCQVCVGETLLIGPFFQDNYLGPSTTVRKGY